MSSSAISFVVFACVFSGALLGLFVRARLPEHHLKDDTLGIVKLATGLIATMSALVLGLLVSSAKGSFDRINNELLDGAAKVVSLDRVLGEYGPEARELRAQLNRSYSMKVDILTSGDRARLMTLDTAETISATEAFHARISQLVPHSDTQRGLRERALQIMTDLATTRTLVSLQKNGSIPQSLLIVLVAWLAIIFAAFGICGPRNYTTIGALLVCSICASGAIFLILEMDQPLDGFIRIPGTALHEAVLQLGR